MVLILCLINLNEFLYVQIINYLNMSCNLFLFIICLLTSSYRIFTTHDFFKFMQLIIIAAGFGVMFWKYFPHQDYFLKMLSSNYEQLRIFTLKPLITLEFNLVLYVRDGLNSCFYTYLSWSSNITINDLFCLFTYKFPYVFGPFSGQSLLIQRSFCLHILKN